MTYLVGVSFTCFKISVAIRRMVPRLLTEAPGLGGSGGWVKGIRHTSILSRSHAYARALLLLMMKIKRSVNRTPTNGVLSCYAPYVVGDMVSTV